MSNSFIFRILKIIPIFGSYLVSFDATWKHVFVQCELADLRQGQKANNF